METVLIILVLLAVLGLAKLLAGRGSDRENGAGSKQTSTGARSSAPAATGKKTAGKSGPGSPVSSPGGAAHSLPAPPQRFVGRKEEFKELLNQDKPPPTLIGIYGRTGVGTSTLAVNLCRRLTRHFPDAQLFFDLKGHSAHPVSPDHVLARIIRLLRPKASLPATQQERAKLYRNLLNGRRILLCLDNARDAEQVKPLIPPKTCLMVVTSRKGLSLPGIQSLELKGLPFDDARALLLDIAPRLGFWSGEIAKQCENLPMALILSANYLVLNTAIDPSVFAKKLRDLRNQFAFQEQEADNPTLEAIFTLIFKTLPKGTASVFRKLMVFPESFDTKAEAFMCEDEDNTHLAHLVLLGLVAHDKVQERYALHDRIRRFLKTHLQPAEQGRAQMRHATYYLTVLVAANEHYSRGGKEQASGLGLFDREWKNIRAGQVWAETHSLKEEDATRLCNAYTEAAGQILLVRESPQERVRWFQAGLKAARKLEDTDAEKKHLLHMGREHLGLNQPEPARECLEKSLALAKEQEDPETEMAALDLLGKACLALNQADRAMEYFEQALNLSRTLEESAVEDDLLEQLALACQKAGETQRAIEVFKQGLARAKKSKNTKAESRILRSMAQAHAARGDLQAANEWFEKGLKLARKVGDQRTEGETLWAMSLLLAKADQKTEAMKLGKTALKILAKISHPHARRVLDQLKHWDKENKTGPTISKD